MGDGSFRLGLFIASRSSCPNTVLALDAVAGCAFCVFVLVAELCIHASYPVGFLASVCLAA
jgi:hypothetical protein